MADIVLQTNLGYDLCIILMKRIHRERMKEIIKEFKNVLYNIFDMDSEYNRKFRYTILNKTKVKDPYEWIGRSNGNSRLISYVFWKEFDIQKHQLKDMTYKLPRCIQKVQKVFKRPMPIRYYTPMLVFRITLFYLEYGKPFKCVNTKWIKVVKN